MKSGRKTGRTVRISRAGWKVVHAIWNHFDLKWPQLGIDHVIAHRVDKGTASSGSKAISADTAADLCLHLGCDPLDLYFSESDAELIRERMTERRDSWKDREVLPPQNEDWMEQRPAENLVALWRDDLDAAPSPELLFKRHAFMRVWYVNPRVPWGGAAFGLLMIFIAWRLGIASLRGPGAYNGGWCYSTWAWSFFILIPVGIELLRRITIRIPEIVGELTAAGNRVFSRGPGQEAGFLAYIGEDLQKRARWWLFLALLLAAVLTFSEGVKPVTAYICHFFGRPGPQLSPDWGAAWRRPDGPSPILNFAFWLVAILGQAWVVVLGVYWAAMFWSILSILGRTIQGQTPFEFRPVLRPGSRLGLRPLAPLFVLFFALCGLLTCYALWHRIEEIGLKRSQLVSEYLSGLFKHPWKSLSSLSEYGFETIDLGTLVLLCLVLVPFLTSWSYFYHALKFVERQRLDPDKVAPTAAEVKQDVWPTGRAVAYLAATVNGALLLTTIAPPAIPLLSFVIPVISLGLWFWIGLRSLTLI